MTKSNSILHRAAALLAALCLLASMALPVYAAETETEFSVSSSETIPGDDNTGNGADGTGSDISVSNLETIQKDADTTNEGSKTEPEISVPESGTITNSADTTDKAADAPPAEGVTGSENTAPADNAAADKTADADKTNLTEENTSDDEEDTADDGEDPAGEAGAKETFFAVDTYSEDETESDDRSAPMTASNEGGTASFIPNTATIYFAVDSNYQNSYWVHLYAQKKNGDSLDKDMSDTGTTITDSEGKEHKIFSVTLSQADYPGGGFDRLIFQYHENGNTENGNTWKGQFLAFGGKDKNNKNWTTIDKIAGKIFDATTSKFDNGRLNVVDNPYNESQWTRVEYYYAGMPLYFKNASGTTLDGVTATFYKKGENNTFEKTGSQTIGTVAANTMADQKITIPNNQSQFVKFSWTDSGEGTLYNFSNDACEGITTFDLAANNCFVYSGNESTESPWQNAGGDLLTKDKTIYFDATLSSYGYDGEGLQQSPMPHKGGAMYCFFVAEDGNLTKVDMVQDPTQENSKRQLWSCKVPGGSFTAVQFSARQDADGKSAVDDLTKQYSTAEIPPNLKAPCFFADDGDPTAYTGRNGDITQNWVFRDGYWGEKDAVRNAESGKGTTVVDIANGTFTQEAGTKYITSTLYDYYTDYELNGFNRDSYPDNNINSQRWYVTFEQFNRALSSAYEKNNSVQYPIYTGHFQPSINNWSCPFADVAKGMGLYGWNSDTGTEEYKKFMAVNNSVLDTTGKPADDEAGYARTFQGLVEDKTSTGDANGLPVLKGKAGTGSLVDPHFNKEFLEGKNTFNTVLGKVYENVSFPFTKDDVFKNTNDTNDKEAKAEYWYYDSSKSSLYLKQDKGNSKYYLSTKDSSGNLTTDGKSENREYDNDTNGTCGFFPFNESVGTGSASQYNYGFGAKLQFDFTLTDDGMVQVGNNANDKVPIKFFFSGDDDVWVYIDGQLVLDVGGAHSKASGLLEFGQTADEQANTVTPYVSSNKTGGDVYEDYKDSGNVKSVYFNGKQVTFDKKGNILNKDGSPFTLTKGTTHTLTMFYMERGMWESNMAVAFNFPDNNELQVEKKVDVTGVNDLFTDSFQNQKIFTFNIKNLATHYGAKDTSYTEGNTEQLPKETYEKAKGSSDASASLEYVQNLPSDIGTGSAVLWSATMDDPTSAHREKRRGTLPLSTAIDISQYSYLTFDVYVEGKQTDTCALGNLYVELLDTESHQKGCINGKGLQSSDVYGAATGLHPGQWYTIRLLLNSLQKDADFNNQLKKITVGDNFARKIYLRNFTFRSAPKEQTKPGFTTEQYDIPDYGSATTGKLENAKYAVFSSDRGNGDVVDVVDENGQFLLQDGETVTFKDQFRRGSYIALKEQVDPNLYDTFWTVYENDAPVTNVSGASEYVMTGSVTTLENVKDTAPNDGRTEKVISGNLNGHDIKNKYETEEKPKDNTLVFRSYSGTADEDELTKLKVVFTNKVKTGKLIIRKEAAPGESLLNETFTFTVKFSNVGGQGLGGDILEQKYYCTVTEQANGKEYGEVEIKGIPVGTRFVVSEVAQEGTNLQLVTITGGGSDRAVMDGIKARGSVVADDTNVATATFVNTKRQLIDLEVTKQWKKQDGMTDIPSNEQPAAIYLKLQRTKTPDKEDNWVDVDGYESVMLKPWYDGWVTKFTGLDKFDATNKGETHEYYTYRVLESVTEAGPFYGGSEGNVIEIGGKKYTILNNTVSCADDSKTSLELPLTNKLQDAKYNLNITKQDAEDKTKLGGVEFKLEKLGTDGGPDATFPAVTRITSSGDADKGKCSFEHLSPGSYRLTETKTAEGYTLLADAIEFELKTDGHCVRDGAGFGNVKYDSATGVYNIALTINNRKSFELPHTGADAPSLWLLIGLPALVAVLLVLVFRYNKKGGRRQ